MHLLYKPIPHENESPGSFLLRASEHNGWKSVSSFLAAIEYSEHYGSSTINAILSHQEKWNKVSNAMGLNMKENSHLCYKRKGVTIGSMVSFLGMPLPWNKLRLNEPAICPICLKEREFTIKHWDFRLVTSCPTHKVKLIDCCQNCGNKLLWDRQSITRCKCGFDLRNSQNEKVSPRTTIFIYNLLNIKDKEKIQNLLDIYSTLKIFFKYIETPLGNYNLVRLTVLSVIKPSYLEKLLTKLVNNLFNANKTHPKIILHPFLMSRSDDLVRVANTIINCMLPSTKQIGESQSSSSGNKSSQIILGISINLLRSVWRTYHLEGYVTKSRSGKNRSVSLSMMKKLVEKLSKQLSLKGSELRYEDIKRLSEIVTINDNFSADSLIIKLQQEKPIARNTQVLKLSEGGYITISEAAKICNVYYENIRFAVHCGFLKRLHQGATKGTQIFISKVIVDDFNRKYIFTKNIATKYDLNPRNIAEKLISAGVNPVSGPSIDGGLTYLFCRSGLELIDFNQIIKIKNYPTNTGRKEVKKNLSEKTSIPLSAVAEILCISPQKASQLIKKGFLVKCSKYKRNISVTYESFNEICSFIDNQDYFSIKHAAHLLNETTKEMHKRYLDTKIIAKVFNGIEYFISATDLDKLIKFKKQYITSKDAANVLGASNFYLNNLHKMGKIKPAKTYKVGKSYIYFYKRRALIQYCESQGFDTYGLSLKTK